MKRFLPVVLLGVATAAVLGCQPVQKTESPPEAVPEVQPVFDVNPKTWAKGQIFRVWHYDQGEMMAYLGAKDGLKKGDILILERDGTPINTIEALEVKEQTFYGRVLDREDEALLPKVGDIAIKGPQPKRPEPTEAQPEKPQGREVPKAE